MKKIALSFITTMLLASSVLAETMYVDDTLLVPLRSGEGTGFRIVHKGLPSGTALEIIEKNTESGYSFVKTASGIEGYLPTRYLSQEPIARDKLARAEKTLATLRAQNKELSDKLSTLQSNYEELEGQHSKASKSLSANTDELARVKAVSADALNLDR
ncbi:hypothetical protein A3750_21320, partial [Oleiphilus sp. HI0079]|uniref:TIGR04211 family SH3 domain-containing protein n=3 Tax=Oleiphilus TaxID=141450 RepID=UPI0007C27D9D